MTKKDYKLFSGARGNTIETWRWVYWALKDRPIQGSKSQVQLRSRIIDEGGPEYTAKEFWDRLRSYSRHGLLNTENELSLYPLAHKNPPSNPYPKSEQVKATLEGLSAGLATRLATSHWGEEHSQPQEVPLASPEPTKAYNLVDAPIADEAEMTIEQRLVAISRLADSILIGGIPAPESDRQQILERLASTLEAGEKLRRENRELSERVTAQSKTMENLRFVNKRLEANVSALTNTRGINDRAFNEIKRLQESIPNTRG